MSCCIFHLVHACGYMHEHNLPQPRATLTSCSFQVPVLSSPPTNGHNNQTSGILTSGQSPSVGCYEAHFYLVSHYARSFSSFRQLTEIWFLSSFAKTEPHRHQLSVYCWLSQIAGEGVNTPRTPHERPSSQTTPPLHSQQLSSQQVVHVVSLSSISHRTTGSRR